MAATHIVTMFLPNTISFAELPGKQRRQTPGFPLTPRTNSAVDLPSRLSQVSLFNGPTPPLTPFLRATTDDDFFLRTTPETTTTALTDNNLTKPKRQHTRFGSRHLIHGDVPDPDWGSPVFNQPRSRAGPLPSASVQDFAKVHDELEQHEERQRYRCATKKPSKPPQSAYTSRNTSSERGYKGRDWTVEPAVHGNGGLFHAVAQACDDDPELEIAWIGTVR